METDVVDRRARQVDFGIMSPQSLTGGGIESCNQVHRRDDVKPVTNLEWGSLEVVDVYITVHFLQCFDVELGIYGGPSPGNFQVFEVRGINLVQR